MTLLTENDEEYKKKLEQNKRDQVANLLKNRIIKISNAYSQAIKRH